MLFPEGRQKQSGNPGYLKLRFHDLQGDNPVCYGNRFYDSSGKNGKLDLCGMQLDVDKCLIKVNSVSLWHLTTSEVALEFFSSLKSGFPPALHLQSTV